MAEGNKYAKRSVHRQDQRQLSKGTRNGNNVWIGAGPIVLDAANVGDGGIATAASVVRRKIPAESKLRGISVRPVDGLFREKQLATQLQIRT